VDFSGPVVRLSSLTPEDFYVLLQKIRGVYAFGDPAKHLLPDEAIFSFMEHCSKRIWGHLLPHAAHDDHRVHQPAGGAGAEPWCLWQDCSAASMSRRTTAARLDQATEADGDDEFASFKL
jgi:hypothetical protein